MSFISGVKELNISVYIMETHFDVYKNDHLFPNTDDHSCFDTS